MTHEKIIKRDDGSTVKIIVNFVSNPPFTSPDYRISVHKKDARKKTWYSPFTTDDYEYRQLPYDASIRRDYELNKYLTIVTKEEIYQAKLDCWELIKPLN